MYLTFSAEADKRLFAEERQNFLQAADFPKELIHPGIREYHEANQPSALSTRCFTLLVTSLRNLRQDYSVPQPAQTLPSGGRERTTSASCVTGRHGVQYKNSGKKIYSTFWH